MSTKEQWKFSNVSIQQLPNTEHKGAVLSVLTPTGSLRPIPLDAQGLARLSSEAATVLKWLIDQERRNVE